MLTIKNPVANKAGAVLLIAVLFTGCMPPGPRAVLDGKKLMERGRYAEAIERLTAATALMETNALAWHYLGLAYHHGGQTTNAAVAYQRALSHDPDLSEARFNLGSLWLEHDRPDLAKPQLVAYTLRHPNSVEGWLQSAKAQVRLREWVAAENSFVETLRLSATNSEALNGLGVVQLQRNRPRDAAQRFSQALAAQPDYAPAMLNLAIVAHHRLNDRALALQQYRQYLALPGRGPDWASVNEIAMALEQELKAAARPVLASAPVETPPPTRPPSRVEVRPPVASASARTNGVPRAGINPAELATATSVKAPEPRRATVTKPAATPAPPMELVRLDREPAVRLAQDAATRVDLPANRQVESQATNPALRSGVPSLQPEKRGLIAKINPLNIFRREKPSDPGATRKTAVPQDVAKTSLPAPNQRYAYHDPTKPAAGDRTAAAQAFAQGTRFQASERYVEAIQMYREAVRLDPAYYEACYNWGLAAASAGDLQEALRVYETSLAIRPDSLDARYNFALVLKQANYLIDSARELEKVLAIHPNEVRAHLILGNIYARQLRQPAKAHEHYSKVLLLDPQNAQAPAIRYWLTAQRP